MQDIFCPFHIDFSHERICPRHDRNHARKVEDALVRSKKFRLPGKKALQASDTVFEVVLVDVSEQPVERPKKAKNGITVAKRSATLKKRR